MQLYNIYRLYVKKYNLSVQFLLTSAAVYFLNPGADAAMRINPEWVEWMMGFPKGWTESISGV